MRPLAHHYQITRQLKSITVVISYLYYGPWDNDALLSLPYQKKGSTMYLQIADTSIKHPISGQATTAVKVCMYICLI